MNKKRAIAVLMFSISAAAIAILVLWPSKSTRGDVLSSKNIPVPTLNQSEHEEQSYKEDVFNEVEEEITDTNRDKDSIENENTFVTPSPTQVTTSFQPQTTSEQIASTETITLSATVPPTIKFSPTMGIAPTHSIPTPTLGLSASPTTTLAPTPTLTLIPSFTQTPTPTPTNLEATMAIVAGERTGQLWPYTFTISANKQLSNCKFNLTRKGVTISGYGQVFANICTVEQIMAEQEFSVSIIIASTDNQRKNCIKPGIPCSNIDPSDGVITKPTIPR